MHDAQNSTLFKCNVSKGMKMDNTDEGWRKEVEIWDDMA